MRHNWAEIIVGAVVLFASAFFLVFVLRSTSGSMPVDHYVLHASFVSAEGISTGGDVRMAGVRIGSVGDMNLNAITYQADVDLYIDQQVKIPTDSEIKVASDGLLGGAFIEVVPGADETVLAEGEQFIYASGSVSLLSLFAKFAVGKQEEEKTE